MFDLNNLQEIQNNTGYSPWLTTVNPAFFFMQSTGLGYVFGIAGIILILNIISSGFKMMTSKGDPKALQGAQAKLTTSSIGILILFASFWIVQLVMQFLGVNTVLFN